MIMYRRAVDHPTLPEDKESFTDVTSGILSGIEYLLLHLRRM